MKKYSVLFLSFILTAFLFATSCGSEGDNSTNGDSTATVEVNEFEVLVQYLETNGNFINGDQVPAMISATDVYENIDNAKYKVIDLRGEVDFLSGHIDHATNIKSADLIDYFENQIVPADYDKIILVCYSGQSASYATSVLRILGYDNVYALKFGMSSWNPVFAQNLWSAKISSDYEDQLETAGNAMNPAGDHPTLNTGLTDPQEILKVRAQAALESPFSSHLVKAEDLFVNGNQYYIMNYWPTDKYDQGHIPGAIQYTPKQSLASTASLYTLPIDKPVVTYCFTGQHAAFVTAYLTILGYDAKSLGFGANSFMHNILKANDWHAFGDGAINNYEYIEEEVDPNATSDGPSCG
ncbi:MAG: hypothetical protein JXR68_02960 [Bacteroidales bacterium]|nr:hypothetical protein [Bacteroidales bacterium]